LKRCAYCSFLSSEYCLDRACQFINALVKEIESLPQECTFTTLYIGGGTPTVLPCSLLEILLASLLNHKSLVHDSEKTIEANPETLDREKLSLIKNSGINRLSIGAQSLNNDELETLGRVHDSKGVCKAFRYARMAGFNNISIDLIFGIPGQTLTDWQRTLHKAITLNPEHISTYGLTVEEGTDLCHALNHHLIELPCEDSVADMYEQAIDTLTGAGYIHYEISNFSKPGYACRHNLNYWDRGDYYGLGPGAYSFVNEKRFSNIRDINLYNKRVIQGRKYRVEEELLNKNQSLFESIFLGLRKTEGIKTEELNERYQVDIIQQFHYHIEELCASGLMTEDSGFLRLTREGMLVSNEILCRFIDY
jgi:oxygen-independent coproporphyrinogen-3 oxidase